MSYPHAVATGNRLIAAALRWLDADQQYLTIPNSRATAIGLLMAEVHLREAAIEHREAAAVTHVQGPDLDADTPL